MKGTGSFAEGFMKGFQGQRDHRLAKQKQESMEAYQKALKENMEAQTRYREQEQAEKNRKRIAADKESTRLRQANPDLFAPDATEVMVGPGMGPVSPQGHMAGSNSWESGLQQKKVYGPGAGLEATERELDRRDKRAGFMADKAYKEAQAAKLRQDAQAEKEDRIFKAAERKRLLEEDKVLTAGLVKFYGRDNPEMLTLVPNGDWTKVGAKNANLVGKLMVDRAAEFESDIEGYNDKILAMDNVQRAISTKYDIKIAESRGTPEQKAELEANKQILLDKVENTKDVYIAKRDTAIAKRQNRINAELGVVTPAPAPVDKNPVNRQEVLANFPVDEAQSQLPNSGFGIGPDPSQKGLMSQPVNPARTDDFSTPY